MSKKMAGKEGRFRRRNLVLVEFKAPMELVEAFDSKLKQRFSSRSEAIRYLMRTFLREVDM